MFKILTKVLSVGVLAWVPSGLAESQKIESKNIGSATKSHNFEDLLIQGKFHFSDESVTTVEEDKVLDGLIGLRSDFSDRIKQSATRK